MTIVLFNDRDLRIALAKLFVSFPSSGRWSEQKLEAYRDALARIPFSFVKEALEYAARGKLGVDLPSAASLAKLAEELQNRGVRRTKTIAEPVINNTHVERARIILGFRELISCLKSGKKIEPDLITAKVFGDES